MYVEYSDPDAAALQRQVNNAVAGNTFEARQAHRDNIISLSHVKACLAAKIDPALGAEDVATAKAYVRARSFAMLHKAWNVVETVLDDPQGNMKLGTKLSTALEVITRAVGRPEVPNTVKADLSQMSPVDAIDLLMQELAAGNIDERVCTDAYRPSTREDRRTEARATDDQNHKRSGGALARSRQPNPLLHRA